MDPAACLTRLPHPDRPPPQLILDAEALTWRFDQITERLQLLENWSMEILHYVRQLPTLSAMD